MFFLLWMISSVTGGLISRKTLLSSWLNSTQFWLEISIAAAIYVFVWTMLAQIGLTLRVTRNELICERYSRWSLFRWMRERHFARDQISSVRLSRWSKAIVMKTSNGKTLGKILLERRSAARRVRELIEQELRAVGAQRSPAAQHDEHSINGAPRK
jgi:hypothetical protein